MWTLLFPPFPSYDMDMDVEVGNVSGSRNQFRICGKDILYGIEYSAIYIINMYSTQIAKT